MAYLLVWANPGVYGVQFLEILGRLIWSYLGVLGNSRAFLRPMIVPPDSGASDALGRAVGLVRPSYSESAVPAPMTGPGRIL